VVMISSWAMVAWLLGCSFAPNVPSLIIMHLLAGVCGSAIVTISSAVVGDIYTVKRRAFGSATIAGANILGPISE
jgi:MFS family permease